MTIPTGRVSFRISKTHVMPATIEREGSRLLINFRFNAMLKDEIKSMEGARWLGFEEPNPRKVWAVADTARNHFQLSYLMGMNPYAPYDSPLVEFTPPPGRTPYSHQIETTAFCLTRRHCIIAEEMGCVDGDAIVHLNRAGRGFQYTIRELFEKFNGRADFRGKRWDCSIPTYIRSLCNDVLLLNRIIAVLHKGYQPVLKLTLKSGKTIRVTADHEICVAFGEYRRLDSLKPGDRVLTNGRWIDKDGYVRVGGLKGIHPRWTTGGVYEHILVMEEKIGRHITVDEVVHHVNRIRHDNAPDNLELLRSSVEHGELHGKQHSFANMHNGEKVCFVPCEDEVRSIIEDGYAQVYDIVCDDPHRNFVANGVIVHNCGKTLSAIMLFEHAVAQMGMKDILWVGPRSALESVKYEHIKWKARHIPYFYTYEAIKGFVEKGMQVPRVLICDEASRCKTPTAQRSQAIKIVADEMRRLYGRECFIILMTGTPAPKDPSDWWFLAEIACPGFLKEGTFQKFRNRLALIKQYESSSGGSFPKLITWWDDENKCKVCGNYEDDPDHDHINMTETWYHPFQKSANEIELLYERMRGLVLVKFKSECLDLPDKIFKIIRCKPSASVLRASKMISKTARSAAIAMILNRELSDGFQYQEIEDGTEVCPLCKGYTTITIPVDLDDPNNPLDSESLTRGHRAIWDDENNQLKGFKDEPLRLEEREIECTQCCGRGKVPHYIRTATRVDCPKDDAVADLLDQYAEEGRFVLWAAFTESVDRNVENCLKQGWQVIRIDGRGWWSSDPALRTPVEMLQAFDDKETYPKLVTVGNPAAGGMGLNLTASSVNCFYSNSFKLEDRLQAIDRIHRPGADHNRGCSIIDLVHLPQDEMVIQSHERKMNLMHMSMGQMNTILSKIEEHFERAT